MSDPRTNELLERAITLICSDHGCTRADALHWLNDDTYAWDNTERVQPEREPRYSAMQQVRRTTKIERTLGQ